MYTMMSITSALYHTEGGLTAQDHPDGIIRPHVKPHIDYRASADRPVFVKDEACKTISQEHLSNGLLARYVKFPVAHAPGMPRTLSPPPRVSNPDVPWCMPGFLISSCLWSRWRGKRSRHSWCMRNPQFYISGKRPMWPSKSPDINTIENVWSVTLRRINGMGPLLWNTDELCAACAMNGRTSHDRPYDH